MSEVYFIKCGALPLVKIGWAVSSRPRLTQLQCGNPFTLNLLASIPGKPELERTAHRAFSKARVRGEWFNLTAELATIIDLASRDASAAENQIELIAKAKANRPNAREFRDDVARAVQGDFAALLEADSSATAVARRLGVSQCTVSNAANGKHVPHVLTALKAWASDLDSLPRTLAAVGVKLVPLEAVTVDVSKVPCDVAKVLPLLIELFADGECCDSDVRHLEKAGAIDCLTSVADMLRNKRDALRVGA